MITISALLKKAKETLKSSNELKTFCQTNFEKDFVLQVGIDEKNPPSENDTPFILLLPLKSEKGQEANFFDTKIGVLWSIKESTIEKSDETKIYEYKGLYLIDEMGELIYSTLTQMSPNIALSKNRYDIEQLDQYPMFSGEMEISIEIPNLLGSYIEL